MVRIPLSGPQPINSAWRMTSCGFLGQRGGAIFAEEASDRQAYIRPHRLALCQSSEASTGDMPQRSKCPSERRAGLVQLCGPGEPARRRGCGLSRLRPAPLCGESPSSPAHLRSNCKAPSARSPADKPGTRLEFQRFAAAPACRDHRPKPLNRDVSACVLGLPSN